MTARVRFITGGPDVVGLDWFEAVRTGTTRIARVPGPFEVVMEHGEVVACDDGWVAEDSAGKLYPITDDVVQESYAPVSNVEIPEPPTWLERVGVLEVHPATAAVLRYFAFEHLPPELQVVSRPFGELALEVALRGQGAEATVAIRKLLEAKDCAVRDVLPPAPAYPLVERDRFYGRGCS